jgi:glycosyltransferase involved in cell wall biosynthesis
MKLAIITNIPAPYRKGQWERFAKIKNLDITIYYCAKREPDRFWEIGSVQGVNEVFLKGISLWRFHFNPGIFAVLLRNFDMFLVGGYGFPTLMCSIIFLRFLKKPYILLIDGVSTSKINYFKRKATSRLKKFFTIGASAYFANGTCSRVFLEDLGINSSNIFNQYLTVDVEYLMAQKANRKLVRKELRDNLGINQNTIVCMYAGRLIREKGIQDLIEVVGSLRKGGYDVIALVVGDGAFRNELVDHATRFPGSTIFAGHIGSKNLNKYYYAANIFVLPTYDDAWGLVVNEAMACGLPIIVTDAAGCHIDLVKDGRNGYIVRPGNVDELARAVKLLIDPNLRESFGKESIYMITKWTYEESASSFKAIIEYLDTFNMDSSR